MLKYANGFSIASDANRETLVLNLLQQFPEIDADGTIGDDIETNLIDSYTFDRSIAIGLAKSILDLMSEDDVAESL